MSRYLWTGLAGPFIYLGTVIAGGWVTPGYSHVANAVSELSQRGAPYALPVGAGFAISALLCLAFGLAVAGELPKLRALGWLISAYGAIAFLLATVFPQDPIGTALTFSGIAHLVLVGVSGLMLAAALVIGGFRLRTTAPWFLAASIVGFVAMILGGAASAYFIANGIPLMGLAERLTLAAYLLWFCLLALVLMWQRRDFAAAARS